MRKRNALLLVLIVFIMLGIYILYMTNGEKNIEFELSETVMVEIESNDNRQSLVDFVENHMMSDDKNIYTNYKETEVMLDHATGHEALSESIGLMMLYYANTMEKDKFDHQVDLIHRYYLNDENLLKWRIREGQHITNVSASIDDLRVIKALMYGYNRWSDEAYMQLIELIEFGLRSYVLNDNQLVSYHDSRYTDIPKGIDVNYLDLEVIRELGKIHKSWNMYYDHGLEIIRASIMKDNVLFYNMKYDYEAETFAEDSQVRMIDNVIVLLHLAQVGELNDDVYNWLKTSFYQENHRIYASYDRKTLEHLNDIESTAIYAMVSRIALLKNDRKLYNDVIERMNLFQITNKTLEIYGAFGDESSLMVYSYDCLNALLSYLKKE